MTQHFEWNIDKNKNNIQKHGISFYDAIQIFKDKYISYLSPRNSEMRMVSLGIVQGRTVAVIYTVREEKIRIISARVARRKEREYYNNWAQKHKSDDKYY